MAQLECTSSESSGARYRFNDGPAVSSPQSHPGGCAENKPPLTPGRSLGANSRHHATALDSLAVGEKRTQNGIRQRLSLKSHQLEQTRILPSGRIGPSESPKAGCRELLDVLLGNCSERKGIVKMAESAEPDPDSPGAPDSARKCESLL
jgi:hypothetical protein